MIEYYEQLDDIKHVIQTLYRQTFLLERKFEKRTGRMVPVREYRVCSKHREFLRKFCSCRNHTAGKSAYGRHVHPGRDTMGEKSPDANLYSGVKADL